MGGIILIGSIVVWSLSAFPRDITYSVDYIQQRNELTSLYNEQQLAAGTDKQQLLEKEKIKQLDALSRAQKAEKAEKSIIGQTGKILSPIFEPIGIDWRGSVALITGFVAKEIVISTMGILYAVDSKDDSDALKYALSSSDMSRLSALSMMVFVLLYLPCLATVSAIKRESGSLKWTLLSIVYNTCIAWFAAFCVYQGGTLLGFG